jgi:hypothetical protein
LGAGVTNGGHNAETETLRPAAARRLLPAGQGLGRCPDCATHFSESIRTDADAGGAWIDLDIERLAPGRVCQLLGAKFQEHDAVIARIEQAWLDRVPEARVLAADWLLDHHARAGHWDRVERLVLNEDAAVHDAALSALLRHVMETRSLPEQLLRALAPLADAEVREFGPSGVYWKLGSRLKTFKLRIPRGA